MADARQAQEAVLGDLQDVASEDIVDPEACAQDQAIPLPMTVEEALRTFISAGVSKPVAPAALP